MVMLKKGDCEHCGRFYRYSLWHSGFGDNSYAYCDECGMLALLNYSNESVAALPSPVDKFGEIEESWEPFLQACPCGGHFRKGASPRCPSCRFYVKKLMVWGCPGRDWAAAAVARRGGRGSA